MSVLWQKLLQLFVLLKKNFFLVLILTVAIISYSWLNKMADILRSDTSEVILNYRVVVEDYTDGRIKNNVVISDSSQREDAQYKIFKEVEEHLRNQMNSWLTILGFFGVLFGLLVPTATFMLQRQTLKDEKDRIIKDCEEKVKTVKEQFDKSLEEAKQKADSALNAASQANEGLAAMKTIPGVTDIKAEEIRSAADHVVIEQEGAK